MKTSIELMMEADMAVLGDVHLTLDDVERLIQVVRADEREACAKVCEEQEELRGHTPFDCAAAIRARKTP